MNSPNTMTSALSSVGVSAKQNVSQSDLHVVDTQMVSNC